MSAEHMPPRRAGLALGLALGWLVVGAAYVVQRLADAVDEPPITAVRATATIPYFWRVGSSLAAGACAGLLAGAAVALDPSGARAAALLRALPALSIALGIALSIAMVAVP
ncbi:MAG: hypothetical protein JNM72_07610 [Deltaproteobacteria bacterium]|nr:hypothetical protein [Deltaproteobacteria bacterium]